MLSSSQTEELKSDSEDLDFLRANKILEDIGTVYRYVGDINSCVHYLTSRELRIAAYRSIEVGLRAALSRVEEWRESEEREGRVREEDRDG